MIRLQPHRWPPVANPEQRAALEARQEALKARMLARGEFLVVNPVARVVRFNPPR